MRTKVFNEWQLIDTFQEVNKETITLISSGVDKTWPVEVKGISSLGVKKQSLLSKANFSAHLVFYTHICAHKIFMTRPNVTL